MELLASYANYLIYFAPLAALFLWATGRRGRLEAASVATFDESVAAGLTQPASLHPVVDTSRCIGCESCVHACPEFPAHQVLGIVEGKAHLVSPTDCIGHGACQKVCPTGAISLVFGTAERGVDIPAVNSDFSTNVPGVFIAGELGGMGLIKNAIEQGRQAVESINSYLQSLPKNQPEKQDALDVLIVGAGPAGIAATLGAMEAGLSHRTIEQHAFGGTPANFPRGKIVMTSPAVLPLIGQVKFRETTKEKLVGFWEQVRVETGMSVSYGERLLGIESDGQGIAVTTSNGTYRTRSLLLAIGRRGTPRKLDVVGEDLAKVSYSLLDPAEYSGQRVLVVGGGDSALEAATSIAREQDTEVALAYRSKAFTRAKKKNRQAVERLVSEQKLSVLLESEVQKIEPEAVTMSTPEGSRTFANDAVLICAGGILPDGLLRESGITIETKYGTA